MIRPRTRRLIDDIKKAESTMPGWRADRVMLAAIEALGALATKGEPDAQAALNRIERILRMR